LQRFSRAMIPRPSLNQYTMALVETAPEGITSTAVQVPFAVYSPPAYAKAKPDLFVAGYYDANSKSVQLYDAAAKKYLPAAEHPFIKGRAIKKSAAQ
jgi:hypothetical protein